MRTSRHLKSRPLIAAALPGLAAQFVAGAGLALELNTDRPGSDFLNFDLPASAQPAMCAAHCDRRSQCLAWTYVKPGVQGSLPRCWLKNSVPRAIAADYAVSGLRGFDYGVDRPGSDYTSFDLQAANPALCAARCANEAQCRAWTYVIPGVQGPQARCWLKNSVPAGIVADYAVSGSRSLEYSIDRPGGDYTNFALPAADPLLCSQQCASDNQCRAFTYVKPGVQGTQARCWLKNIVPPAIVADYAVSSAKGWEYDADRPGSDYLDFDLPAPDPALCEARCVGDTQCQAWTYVRVGFQGDFPRCWLKNNVPALVRGAEFAISGTRAAAPQPGASQVGPPANFAGRWSANDFGTLELTQSGNRASGDYSGGGGGFIDGIVQGRVWQGNWVSKDGKNRGSFRVELAADGSGFNGTFETTGFVGRFNATRA